ncbi:MAG: hypothetical protein AAFR61_06555 [Bacteroidota bacterium]
MKTIQCLFLICFLGWSAPAEAGQAPEEKALSAPVARSISQPDAKPKTFKRKLVRVWKKLVGDTEDQELRAGAKLSFGLLIAGILMLFIPYTNLFGLLMLLTSGIMGFFLRRRMKDKPQLKDSRTLASISAFGGLGLFLGFAGILYYLLALRLGFG